MPNSSKNSLRNDMKAVLSNLDPRWVSAGSHRVCSNLLKLLEKIKTQQAIDTLLGYTSFFPSEIDLSYLFSLVSSSTRIFLPSVSTVENTMSFLEVTAIWNEKILSGHYSVSDELQDLHPFENHLSLSSVALVPGIGFDRQGNRIGRGKGYYDRFLEQTPGIVTIGICWDLQVVEKVPIEEHDQKLDWICTESEIIRC